MVANERVLSGELFEKVPAGGTGKVMLEMSHPSSHLDQRRAAVGNSIGDAYAIGRYAIANILLCKPSLRPGTVLRTDDSFLRMMARALV